MPPLLCLMVYAPLVGVEPTSVTAYRVTRAVRRLREHLSLSSLVLFGDAEHTFGENFAQYLEY